MAWKKGGRIGGIKGEGKEDLEWKSGKRNERKMVGWVKGKGEEGKKSKWMGRKRKKKKEAE